MRQVQFQLHCVVQNAADTDQLGLKNTIEQQMSRAIHNAGFIACAIAAVAQMITGHYRTEFRALATSETCGIISKISQRRYEKPLVALARRASEAIFRLGQNINDIGTRPI